MLDPRVEQIEEKVGSYLAALPDNNKTAFEFRMSAAGLCPRLMDYQIQMGKLKRPLKLIENAERGHALHTMWQGRMKAALGDDFTCIEEELIYELSVRDGDTVSIPGHIDGYIPSLDAIYECKSVSEYTYKLVEKIDKPLPQNHEQGNFYAHSKGVSNILFHYYNASSGESLRFLVPYSKGLAERTTAKFLERVLNATEHKIADRPYNDATASPCWYCERKDQCYQGFKAEVAGMGTKKIDDKLFCHGLALCDSARTSRLECEKIEKKVKPQIADTMIGLGLNECVTPDFRVKIKIGKNNNPGVEIKPVKKSLTEAK